MQYFLSFSFFPVLLVPVFLFFFLRFFVSVRASICEQKGDVDSDAGGEDDDFGDEVRSDDEEEVGNDDANEGGGTLHQVRLGKSSEGGGG